MTNIAQHIRIFDASPTDDLVEKRRTAISTLVDSFKKRSGYPELIGLANDIANGFVPKGHLSEALASQVSSAISGASPSFVSEGHELEVKVCAALAALTWIKDASASPGAASKTDILALGIWSSLSFQRTTTDVKIEKLRDELVFEAKRTVLGSAISARQRINVPDATVSLADGDQLAQLEKKLKDGALKAIAALRVNAALDREEIDALWWALGDWSATLKTRLSSLSGPTAALVGGIEIARLLKRVPSDAHRHLILRHVADVTPKCDMLGFLGKVGAARAVVAAFVDGNSLLAACPNVFPLLSSLQEADPKPSGHKVDRSIDEWGARALLEASILHLSALPVVIS